METDKSNGGFNIQHIADEGAKIYEQIKSQYEDTEKGKFLAIDIDSKDVYLGNTSSEAMELAKISHPDKIFFVVRIGFDTIERMARSFINN